MNAVDVHQTSFELPHIRGHFMYFCENLKIIIELVSIELSYNNIGSLWYSILKFLRHIHVRMQGAKKKFNNPDIVVGV